jgi:amylosucrase
MSDGQTQRWATLSLERIWPRIAAEFADWAAAEPVAWGEFEARLRREWGRLFGLLLGLYGGNYDFFYQLEQLVLSAARSWRDRAPWLKERDRAREADPQWFQSQQMVGAVLYVDRFAHTLAGLAERIPYLKQLGVTYLHLMPLFRAPEGNSDGGYAVSSYREVNPALGTIDELRALAERLHAEGISLVLDFVFNHTSDEHEWALRAQRGEPEYTEFYYLFPDRTVPDQYQRTLREIFPTVRRGNFTYREDIGQWVWTTFNSFQWDLNYSNPAVFRAMAEEMLFIANVGIEFLRLDAVAFVWKQMGTGCENLPEAHAIIQAYNAVARIAAPALLFKSEAIVAPRDVNSYIGLHECQVSYNPLLMALLWDALATRDVRLLQVSLHNHFALPGGCAWVNYLRSHDDIGWTFDDDEARALGIEPYGHRRFLNDFYTGRFEGAFARGLPFQQNPVTGDARVCGSLASLAGLEEAVQADDDARIALAIRRILLLHSVVLGIGGIPLIYIGDELGTLNDYSYASDADKAGDSRWVHRPQLDWARAERRSDPSTAEGQIYEDLLRLIDLRRTQPAFWGGAMELVESGNDQIFGFVRSHGGQRLLALANFSERPQSIDANRVRVYGSGYHFTDITCGETRDANAALILEPYQFVWLVPQ